MEIVEDAEGWALNEKSGDWEFQHTFLILRKDGVYYRAKTTDREITNIRLDDLETVPIPEDDIWPLFNNQFKLAPKPLPPNCYIKGPKLLETFGAAEILLHEIKVCELLMGSPHPNIVPYLGCLQEGKYVKGLCFTRYIRSLSEYLASQDNSLDAETCLQGIRSGVRHLHCLGLIHNDINPHNIMLDERDTPIIIDFDSCEKEGDQLGLKVGTPEWSKLDTTHSLPENDFYGIEMISRALRDKIHVEEKGM